MAIDAKGKITFEMVSPGQAFQQHLEKHHNVSAVTPAWLDNTPKQSMSNLKEMVRKEMINGLNEVAKQKFPEMSR